MPEDRRLARLHRDLIEQHLHTEVRKNILHKIVLAHRNAARHEKNIEFEPVPDFGAKIFKVVSRNPELVRVGSGFANLSVNCVSVAVTYLAWPRKLLDVHQL